ncbi:MAG: hypothetical protein OEV44_09710 [Spirochaetota bacterium]|nr:hypothetical protein [Spirochaetota bacterium]
MSAMEKREINARLAKVAISFGLKFKITVNNAQKVIEDNYRKIREIDDRMKHRIQNLEIAA